MRKRKSNKDRRVDENHCGSQNGSLTCTLAGDHKGQHKALGFRNECCGQWPRDVRGGE
jgi:hypothetical protein